MPQEEMSPLMAYEMNITGDFGSSFQDIEKGTLHLNTKDIPEGMVYSWITESILGEPQLTNVQSSFQNYWRPVPASRHPDLAAPDIGGSFSNVDKNIIRRGGCILMERSKKIDDAERAKYERVNQETQKAANWANITKMNDDPYMPAKTYINESQFGRV